jgi:hypothetical protein
VPVVVIYFAGATFYYKKKAANWGLKQKVEPQDIMPEDFSLVQEIEVQNISEDDLFSKMDKIYETSAPDPKIDILPQLIEEEFPIPSEEEYVYEDEIIESMANKINVHNEDILENNAIFVEEEEEFSPEEELTELEIMTLNEMLGVEQSFIGDSIDDLIEKVKNGDIESTKEIT